VVVTPPKISQNPGRDRRTQKNFFVEAHMLFGYFMRTKKRATIVREIFREYMESCCENTKIMEQRALESSPGYEPIILICFRLQHLLSERLTIRFEYLVSTDSLDCARFKSLDDVQKRLDQEWTEAEEAAVKAGDARYSDISREIEAIQFKWVPDSLTVPLQKLMQDDIYRAESLAHAEKIREFQKRMA
jgi:hypothetical protein